MGNNDMWLWGGALVLGGAAVTYMSCEWNIDFLCDIRNNIEEFFNQEASGETGGNTNDEDEDEDKGKGKKSGKKKTELSLSDAMMFYATKIPEELDDYNGGKLTRTNKLNIQGYLLQNHKSSLQMIAKSVGLNVDKRLDGKASYEYTRILVAAANKFNVSIPAKIKAELYKTLESGYKSLATQSQVFSHMTISVA